MNWYSYINRSQNNLLSVLEMGVRGRGRCDKGAAARVENQREGSGETRIKSLEFGGQALERGHRR